MLRAAQTFPRVSNPTHIKVMRQGKASTLTLEEFTAEISAYRGVPFTWSENPSTPDSTKPLRPSELKYIEQINKYGPGFYAEFVDDKIGYCVRAERTFNTGDIVSIYTGRYVANANAEWESTYKMAVALEGSHIDARREGNFASLMACLPDESTLENLHWDGDKTNIAIANTTVIQIGNINYLVAIRDIHPGDNVGFLYDLGFFYKRDFRGFLDGDEESFYCLFISKPEKMTQVIAPHYFPRVLPNTRGRAYPVAEFAFQAIRLIYWPQNDNLENVFLLSYVVSTINYSVCLLGETRARAMFNYGIGQMLQPVSLKKTQQDRSYVFLFDPNCLSRVFKTDSKRFGKALLANSDRAKLSEQFKIIFGYFILWVLKNTKGALGNAIHDLNLVVINVSSLLSQLPFDYDGAWKIADEAKFAGLKLDEKIEAFAPVLRQRKICQLRANSLFANSSSVETSFYDDNDKVLKKWVKEFKQLVKNYWYFRCRKISFSADWETKLMQLKNFRLPCDKATVIAALWEGLVFTPTKTTLFFAREFKVEINLAKVLLALQEIDRKNIVKNRM